MSSKIYMESTAIDAAKTANEIEMVLMKAGATGIAKRYLNGELVSMQFVLPISGEPTPFSMPARIKAIADMMYKRKSPRSRMSYEDVYDQARRTAWRILLRWVQAQCAIVQTGMVDAGEAFMPYITLKSDGHGEETLYDRMKRLGQQKALPMIDAGEFDDA